MKKNMFRLTRDNLIVPVVVLAVLGIVSAVFVYLPQNRELKRIRGDIASHKIALRSDAAKAATVPQMIRQVEKMTSRYENFDRRLPRYQEIDGFLRQITGNLSEEGLGNPLIETGNPTKEQLFHTLPIKMKFRGSYLSLARFLERLEKAERLTRVGMLKINADPNHESLDIELQVNIYFTES